LDKTKLSEFLNRRPLIALGETSYGIYILHVPVIWLFERWLNNSMWIENPRQIFELGAIPMLIGMGLLIHYYLDQPLRVWLKKILQQINFPLLLLDFVIITTSIYLSFRLRFENNREYESYREMGRFIFYIAFLLRTALAVYFNSLDTTRLLLPISQMFRPVIQAVSVGSVLLFAIASIGFAVGWLENFPRSVFFIDWIIVIGLSLLTRLVYRFLLIRFSSARGFNHA
jgi:hypothetical protein